MQNIHWSCLSLTVCVCVYVQVCVRFVILASDVWNHAGPSVTDTVLQRRDLFEQITERERNNKKTNPRREEDREISFSLVARCPLTLCPIWAWAGWQCVCETVKGDYAILEGKPQQILVKCLCLRGQRWSKTASHSSHFSSLSANCQFAHMDVTLHCDWEAFRNIIWHDSLPNGHL